MSTEGRADALRAEFDATFARRAEVVRDDEEDFVAIRAGGAPYALRLTHVALVARDRRVTATSGKDPWFLGVAGLRGALVPVYDLRAILGHPAASSAPRWLALARASRIVVALAFDAFEAHVRLPRASVTTAGDGHYVRGALRGDVVRPLVHVPALLETIAARVKRDGTKESG